MAFMQGALRGLILVVCLPKAVAMFLAGPKAYMKGEEVLLQVNKLTSAKNQLPYDYYYLPFCKEEKVEEQKRSFGEILTGDKIQSSPYKIQFNLSVNCHLVCPPKKLQREDKDKFRAMIDDGYYVNWLVDGLAGATQTWRTPYGSGSSIVYNAGFPLGHYDSGMGRFYLYNHVELRLEYHNDPGQFEGNRIVGFMISPRSIKHNPSHDCSGSLPPFDIDEADKLSFTYDVSWALSDIRWAHRWDLYRINIQGQIHWFGIYYSLLIVLLLAGMVAMILLSTLHRDVDMEEASEETGCILSIVACADVWPCQKEETGWKLVYGDVFRKPPHFVPLIVSVGSGMQLLGMSVVTMSLSLVGLLSPAHRGNILQYLILLFAIMGTLAGYVAGRFTKVVDEASSQKVSWLTGTLYPGAFFVIFFMLNLLLFGEESSGAVPFSELLLLLVLWFGVSVPLVLLGFRRGFLMDPIELPVKTSAIPREIPEQPIMSNPVLMALAGGLLVFSAIFTELYFIMRSIWTHDFYFLFGYLAFDLVILTVTCAEVSISLTYFQLKFADYRWWWHSFCASGSSGLYMFLYAILFFETRLDINHLVSMIIYFSYMSIASVMFGLLTGSIGFVSAFLFVRAIYGSVKIV